MRTKLLFLLLLVSFSIHAQQYTVIPDVNFENKLIELGIDSGTPDGRVLTSKAAVVTYLGVNDCSITDLTGIEDFIALNSLSCYNNRLSKLNLSKNNKLASLHCSNNLLTTLDLANNPLLTSLECDNNKLTMLDFSSNTALKTIFCHNNQLTSIDVSKQLMLESLNCSRNSIKILDLFSNLMLRSLWCSNNLLKSLDLSKNNKLAVMTAHTNLLTYLNIQNGANYLFNPNASYATFYGNYLECIQVDNIEDAKKIWSQAKDPSASFSTDCPAYTLIPDVNFENKLIALGIDTDGKNGKVKTENISKVTTLNISRSSITNLTGIQDFTALTSLDCSSNNITNLDLSKNTALTSLKTESNRDLNTLNVSKNTNLTYLDGYGNALETLDLTSNTALKFLRCGQNYTKNFTTLNLSQNINLTDLDVSHIRNLTTLDLRKNTALRQLKCNNTQLTSLNLSMNTALEGLFVNNNKLSTLDISNNTLLQTLICDSNQITALDISNNKALTFINCASNNLKSLNLKNGNNSNFLQTHKIYQAGNYIEIYKSSFKINKDLTCIQVDNIDYARTNWSELKNEGTYFTSLDCSLSTIITDPKFEDKLIALNIDKDGKNGAVLNSSISTISALDLSNSSISDLTGIEGFTALTNLNVSNNVLQKLDVSKNAAINTLNTANNAALTCIQVSDLTAAAKWAVTKDAFTHFNLDCNVYTLIPDPNFEDKLIALNIDRDGKNGKVKTESISKVTSLNISQSSISDLTGIQDFKSLTDLEVTHNKISVIDLSKNAELSSLSMYGNNLKAIDLQHNTKLTFLSLPYNALTSLDVSKNKELIGLYCSNNQIEKLDVSKNLKLSNIMADTNALTSANLKNGKNTLIYNFSLAQNPNLSCIQVDDVNYSNANWATKKDATATFSSSPCPVKTLYTLIPDVNFEKKLIADKLDTGIPDGKVLTEAIAAVKSLDLSNSSITNLTGIEAFKELTFLKVSQNQLTTLDLSSNTKLTTLYASENKLKNINIRANILLTNLSVHQNELTALDVSQNKKLTNISTANNNLTTLDVSENIELYTLICGSNQLTALDVIKNLSLKSLQCDNNQITTLDLSQNKSLVSLFAYKNNLTTLDLSQNITLISVYCRENQLSSINLPEANSLKVVQVSYNKLTALDLSKNKSLTELYAYENQLKTIDLSENKALNLFYCDGNQLTSLDLSKNTVLKNLTCSSNKLTYLNVKNGNNINLNLNNTGFLSNTNLTCIQVDDAAFSNTNWSNRKDTTATFNTDCTPEFTLPADNFAIQTKSESCLGENNGEISIVGKATFAYTATINDKPYTFTNNSLKVSALAPGNYKVKITIPDVIFEQNFAVTIAKGATITGKSSVTAKTVNVEIMEGTAPFTVFVNGTEQFKTDDAAFSVDVAKNALVEVATAKACEGVFAKKVSVSDFESQILSAYPNPTSGGFEIEIPGAKNEVQIELYNFSGQLVSTKNYVIENGKALLNLDNQPSGIYAAKIYLETPEYIKIIKK
ncbi:T9SS type A sorting domain-containing protein [Flavobacterium sp. N502540]|uniref:T9SS type A sorting domain-containing protein n=1 Tax=Flavobacterium sp. N502540 TaxID=2986838 RepID=UPI002225149F|nr:T9SS type A sorting domain-containing protein [Flavobacterium sp. N502540]